MNAYANLFKKIHEEMVSLKILGAILVVGLILRFLFRSFSFILKFTIFGGVLGAGLLFFMFKPESCSEEEDSY